MFGAAVWGLSCLCVGSCGESFVCGFRLFSQRNVTERPAPKGLEGCDACAPEHAKKRKTVGKRVLNSPSSFRGVASVALNSSVSYFCGPPVKFLMAADDLASLSRRIRGVQRKLRRRRAGDDVGQGVLSSKTASAAIMVYVFSGHNLDVAAEFLIFKFHLTDDCMEDMRCMVENAYLQEPNSRVVELMNDQCVATRSMRVMSTACTFILHRQLYVWLCKQNCERGVAPSRTQMIRHALSVVPSDCPLEVQACVEAPLRGSARRQRKWLRRFRRVWGARVGSLQPISTLSVQEMQEKAGQGECWGAQPKGRKKIRTAPAPILVVAFWLLRRFPCCRTHKSAEGARSRLLFLELFFNSQTGSCIC